MTVFLLTLHQSGMFIAKNIYMYSLGHEEENYTHTVTSVIYL